MSANQFDGDVALTITEWVDTQQALASQDVELKIASDYGSFKIKATVVELSLIFVQLGTDNELDYLGDRLATVLQEPVRTDERRNGLIVWEWTIMAELPTVSCFECGHEFVIKTDDQPSSCPVCGGDE